MSPRILAPGARELLETPFLQLLRDALDEMTEVHGLILVDGPVGTGKTTAIRNLTPDLGLPVVYNRLGSRPGTAKVLRHLLSHFETVPLRLPSDEAERRLYERLAERDRVVVVDEAQKLGRDGIDALVDLHDHDEARFTLVMVGARVAERLAPFEEFASRTARVVRFHRLAGQELLDTLTLYHPMLAATDRSLLTRLDERHMKGNLRNWAFFTHAAYNRLEDSSQGVDEETALVCLAVMGLVAT
jgi:DNA transposition AAA+ family ATPase